MARTQFTFTVNGRASAVPVVSGDYIRLNRALMAEGLELGSVSVFEYEHRLAHQAGLRLGIITEEDFLAWADTVQDFTEDEDAEGESPATPA